MTQCLPDLRMRARPWTIVVAAVSAVMMTLDITIVTVALPSIGTGLSLGLDAEQWIVNAYTLAFGALLLAAGSVSDRLGRRSIFLLGHVLFAAASAACALSGSDVVLIAARAVQGAGASLVFGTVMPMVADCFGPDEGTARTKAIGLVSAISGLAAAVGPLLGGLLVDLGSWRLVFAVNLPISLAVLAVTVLRIPDLHGATRDAERPTTAPVDPPSLALAVVGLFLLNYGLLNGPRDGWTDAVVVATLAAAATALVAFVARQRARGRQAMVDLAMFRIPSFSAVAVLSFAARMFSFGMFPFVILWLGGAVQLSPTGIGLVMGTMALPMLLTAIPASGLQRWFRVGHILGAGMAIAAAGLVLGLVVQPGSSWTALVPCFVVVGIGSGLTFPYIMDVAVAVVPPTRSGAATGIANTAFPLGTSCGVAVYGALVSAAVHDGMAGAPDLAVTAAAAGRVDLIATVSPALADTAERAFVSGLHSVFLVAAACAAVAAVAVTVGVRDRDRWTAPPDDPDRPEPTSPDHVRTGEA